MQEAAQHLHRAAQRCTSPALPISTLPSCTRSLLACLRSRSLGLVAASPPSSSRGVLRPPPLPLRALPPDSPLAWEVRERWYSCGWTKGGKGTAWPALEWTTRSAEGLEAGLARITQLP